MRTTFAIKFYCRESKANKDGYAPIEVSLSVNGSRLLFNLPRKEMPKVFQKGNKELDKYLSLQRIAINNHLSDMVEQGIEMTAANIKQVIATGKVNSKTLAELFDEFKSEVVTAKHKKGKISTSVYNKYIFDMQLFATIFDIRRTVSSFSKTDAKKWLNYVNDNYKPHTVKGKINRIKSSFIYAIEKDYIKENPFKGLKLDKVEEVVEYLTQDELNKIRAYSSPIERLEKVRDLFLFQCGSGLAFADMQELTKEDIQESNGTYYITKKRIKTKVQYTAVLLPFAADILQKYGYSLPTISNQKMNAYLAEVGDICGIAKKMHSHLGRKTYATLLLNNHVSIHTVSKSLGHTNIRQTQLYAHKLQESIVSEIGSIADKFK